MAEKAYSIEPHGCMLRRPPFLALNPVKA